MRRARAVRAGLLTATAVVVLASTPGVMAQAVGRRGLDPSRVRASVATPSSRHVAGRDSVRPGDDATFRPTVVIRRGTSQGSGTIIATTAERSLILTAAHVVREEGPLQVELHRYNVGLEGERKGEWPLVVPADVVATDRAGDVSLLSVRALSPLPFVAPLFDGDPDDLASGSLVTSLGIDQGARVASWNTKLVESARFQLEDDGIERPFLITLKIPAHGRSGGGLFTGDGRLVGVCVGHAEIYEGRRMGVFASIVSVRRLLREYRLDAEVARSQSQRPTPVAAR